MTYIYGATVKERVWLTLPVREAPGYVTTKLKIVICDQCKTGSRIIEGYACLTCQMLGIGTHEVN